MVYFIPITRVPLDAEEKYSRLTTECFSKHLNVKHLIKCEHMSKLQEESVTRLGGEYLLMTIAVMIGSQPVRSMM